MSFFDADANAFRKKVEAAYEATNDHDAGLCRVYERGWLDGRDEERKRSDAKVDASRKEAGELNGELRTSLAESRSELYRLQREWEPKPKYQWAVRHRSLWLTQYGGLFPSKASRQLFESEEEAREAAQVFGVKIALVKVRVQKEAPALAPSCSEYPEDDDDFRAPF